MLPPDHLTLFERQYGMYYKLVAVFMHGTVEVYKEIGEFDQRSMSWRLLADAMGVDNYMLVVEQVNAQACDSLHRLCYNCHGLKIVEVRGNKKSTGFRWRRTVKCSVCKGRGVLAADTQLVLL